MPRNPQDPRDLVEEFRRAWHDVLRDRIALASTFLDWTVPAFLGDIVMALTPAPGPLDLDTETAARLQREKAEQAERAVEEKIRNIVRDELRRWYDSKGF